jgi:hypothetical protein
MMLNTITPINNMNTQHSPSMISVKESGGLLLPGASAVGCSLIEEVGIGVDVATWLTNGAPDIGTMVGTYVGIG